MDPLPIQYLHLETVILAIFLPMMLLIQLARTTEAGHFTRSGRAQMFWLLMSFVLLTMVFSVFLFKLSPLLAVELAAGFTLSLLHPVNALCFFIHLLYLRPWEIVPDNPVLLALPRLLALFCFFSWLLHLQDHGKPAGPGRTALKLLLGFSVWSFLSTFAASSVAEVQADWFGIYFKCLVLFVMCLFFIDSERSVVEFELTLVISTLALMAVGFYQFISSRAATGRLESFGMFGNSNDLAAMVVMVIPFAVAPLFSRVAGLGTQSLGILLFRKSGYTLVKILKIN